MKVPPKGDAAIVDDDELTQKMRVPMPSHAVAKPAGVLDRVAHSSSSSHFSECSAPVEHRRRASAPRAG